MVFEGSGLDESQQALVLLRGPEKLERNTPLADRSDHGRHFQRRLILIGRDLQIKNIIHVDLSVALDDASADRNVHYDALSAHFAPGKRQIEAHRNPEMLTSLDLSFGKSHADPGSHESAAAMLATEGGHHQQRRDPLTGGNGLLAQDFFLTALRAMEEAGHSVVGCDPRPAC